MSNVAALRVCVLRNLATLRRGPGAERLVSPGARAPEASDPRTSRGRFVPTPVQTPCWCGLRRRQRRLQDTSVWYTLHTDSEL